VGAYGGLTAEAADPVAPDFVPSELPLLFDGAGPVPDLEFMDETAIYLGAVRPGEASPWYRWMSFPED
jgi:hypothetical protein